MELEYKEVNSWQREESMVGGTIFPTLGFPYGCVLISDVMGPQWHGFSSRCVFHRGL